MFRYFGYLLIAIMTLVLAGGVVLFLFGALADRAAVQGAVRLVALDAVAPLGGTVRFGAFLQDADYDRPIGGTWLIARLDDGLVTLLVSDSRGEAAGATRAAIAPGRHRFTVSLPDTQPREDVLARGSLWVLPPDRRVLWIDAEAIVPILPAAGAMAGGRPAPVSSGVTDALQRLAADRQPLYVVAAKPEDYASVRRALDASGVPPGPVVWLKPGGEAEGLGALRRVLPNVDGALASAPALAGAAARLKVPLWRVSRAGELQADAATAWREAVDVLSLPHAIGQGAGEVK